MGFCKLILEKNEINFLRPSVALPGCGRVSGAGPQCCFLPESSSASVQISFWRIRTPPIRRRGEGGRVDRRTEKRRTEILPDGGKSHREDPLRLGHASASRETVLRRSEESGLKFVENRCILPPRLI